MACADKSPDVAIGVDHLQRFYVGVGRRLAGVGGSGHWSAFWAISRRKIPASRSKSDVAERL